MQTYERTSSALEAAPAVGYHPNWLKSLAGRGMVPGTRRGKKWFFSIPELKAHFINSTREEIEAKNA